MRFEVEELAWGKMGGLIPAIVQDFASRRVLMLGYMNREALQKSLEIQRVTFWSRSRGELWTKGETSGHYLLLEEIRPDCDSDALLVLARPQGPTCHRGTRCCFGEDGTDPGLGFLADLEQLIAGRRQDLPEGSYTTRLFQQGLPKIAQKLGEEAVELIVTTLQGRQRSLEECADLIYHLIVFLQAREVRLEDVLQELQRRHRPSA